jgi:hypothetical protein
MRIGARVANASACWRVSSGRSKRTWCPTSTARRWRTTATPRWKLRSAKKPTR